MSTGTITRTPRAAASSVAPPYPQDPGMQMSDGPATYPDLNSPAVPDLSTVPKAGTPVDSLQAALAAELNLGFVPSQPFTVDALRVLRYVQLKGALCCESASFSEATSLSIEEVSARMGWDILPSNPGLLRIVDFNDFQMIEI